MNREEYLGRAIEMSVRGEKHPHSILTEEQVKEIKHAVWQREEIRNWIRDNVSEAALCKKYEMTKRELWEFRDCVTEIAQARKQRQEMQEFVTNNLTNLALAKRFNVSGRTIDSIVQHRRWVHVEADRRMVHRIPVLQNLQSTG